MASDKHLGHSCWALGWKGAKWLNHSLLYDVCIKLSSSFVFHTCNSHPNIHPIRPPVAHHSAIFVYEFCIHQSCFMYHSFCISLNVTYPCAEELQSWNLTLRLDCTFTARRIKLDIVHGIAPEDDDSYWRQPRWRWRCRRWWWLLWGTMTMTTMMLAMTIVEWLLYFERRSPSG